jgi:Fic family protein
MGLEPGWPQFSTESVEWRPADGGLYIPRSARRRFSGPYQASVPPKIADAKLRIDAELATLLAEAESEIARFDGESKGELLGFAALLLRTEAASSSQIEQLTSSARSIALAELGITGKQNADLIAANVSAMTTAIDQVERVGADSILLIHKTLMEKSLPSAAGHWREQQVWVGGSSYGPHGADHIPPAASRVPEAIEDLVAFANRDDLPLLAQLAITHAQFESIHPFVDGNGRTGRALLHVQLRLGELTRNTLVPISAGLLSNTTGYFDALRSYQAGDPYPIIKQISEAVFPALRNARMLLADIREIREKWAE